MTKWTNLAAIGGLASVAALSAMAGDAAARPASAEAAQALPRGAGIELVQFAPQRPRQGGENDEARPQRDENQPRRARPEGGGDGQRGDGQRGGGQRGESQRNDGQRGEGPRGESQRNDGQRGESQRGGEQQQGRQGGRGEGGRGEGPRGGDGAGNAPSTAQQRTPRDGGSQQEAPPAVVRTPPVMNAPPAVVRTPSTREAPPNAGGTAQRQDPGPNFNAPGRGGPGMDQAPGQRGGQPGGQPPRGGRFDAAGPSGSGPSGGPSAGPGGRFERGERPASRPRFERFDDVKRSRREQVEDGGRRTVVREADNRVIVKQGKDVFIRGNETSRFERLGRDSGGRNNVRRIPGRDGNSTTVLRRPNGFNVYTETDRQGRLVRRYRRGPDGRDHVLIDNRRRGNNGLGKAIAIGVGVGVGAAILGSIVDMPPPRVSIPRDRYIVEYDRASEDDIYDALSAPPIESINRHYTLDEVRYSRPLRDYMRRIDLNDINFEFGSFEIDENQYDKLERLAQAMLRVIDRNPDEVFLIEGHTDLVGSEVDNMTLSDRRAESVAVVLTEQFDVPPENLTTQGYGEQYPKIETEAPERANRRVTVRRITPLLSRGPGG